MRSYKLLFALAVAAVFALLAACGDDDDDGGGATTPAATQATATAAAGSPTPGGAAAGELFFDCDAEYPAEAPDESAFPVTVTDDNGREITIEEPPVAVLSMDAAHTEALFAIGAGDQVAAVDNTSDCPAAVEGLPRVDAYTPSVEAVTALQPDFVIVNYDPGDFIASLEAAGIEAIFLDFPGEVNGVYDQIELLGQATGHAGPADELVTEMADEVRAVVAEAEGAEPPTVYHELDNTFFSVGDGSFIDDMYTLLGANNLGHGTGQAAPQLSAEAIIAANPDVIVLADEQFGENAQTVAARPGWSEIDAVKSGRIYAIDPDIGSRPGPRIVDAIRLLKEALYP